MLEALKHLNLDPDNNFDAHYHASSACCSSLLEELWYLDLLELSHWPVVASVEMVVRVVEGVVGKQLVSLLVVVLHESEEEHETRFLLPHGGD